MLSINDSYVHLVRLALEGRQQDIQTLIRKNIKEFSLEYPELANQLKNELITHSSKGNITRSKTKESLPLPIDLDSKLELAKIENIIFNENPNWPQIVSEEINLILKERFLEKELISKGLFPTRSALFIGAPGVGKTMAAKWISSKLGIPLLTLDLAAVMSSYLGRTGNNIRAVLEYAKKNNCVLLLDEFDAIAKKRDDDSEIGELKRLVTVLLQEIDEWPETGLLIAATNHEELLDPAVWRRFERVINFPNPTVNDLELTISELLRNDHFKGKKKLVEILSILLEGLSYAEVTKKINNIRKESVLSETSISNKLEEKIVKMCNNIDRELKINLALKFLSAGYSQRKIAELLGLSRDTIRKYSNKHIIE